MKAFRIQTAREFGWLLLSGSAVVAAYALLDGKYAIANAAAAVLQISFIVLWFGTGSTPGKVDIWEYQKVMMESSRQVTPDQPVLTEGTLLYIALAMEELAETLVPVASALDRWISGSYRPELSDIVKGLREQRCVMSHYSARLRRSLAKEGTLWVPLSRSEAVEMLDGVTDTAVTLAGLSLASGLPARQAYLEVLTSNLSKRNPDTDMIDKDNTGKWIKGADYVPPNLLKVLEVAWPRNIDGEA